jgi:hypothetical protein
MRWNSQSSISSTIAASISIGLTIPDAICTVLCSWWWAEEPPETCRVIYRNKRIEKTLHIFGCTLEIYLRCMDIRKSKIKSFASCLWLRKFVWDWAIVHTVCQCSPYSVRVPTITHQYQHSRDTTNSCLYPWSRFLLGKAIGPQLIRNFSRFMETEYSSPYLQK